MTDPRPLADRFIAAQHALDHDGDAAVDAMVALFAPDATLVNSALRLAGTQRTGTDGAQAFWRDYAQSLHGAATVFHAVTASGQDAGLFWTTTLPPGGDPEAGPPLAYDGATWLRFDDAGLVRSLHGYYDTRALTPPA